MTERRSLATAVNSIDANADAEKVRAFVTQTLPRQNAISKPKGTATGYRSGVVAVTLRLRPEIAHALKQASLERQLNSEEVFTQQDIVQQILEPWLKQNGHLP